MDLRRILVLSCAALILSRPATALAERELHWNSVDVTAHLDALGSLRVSETQAMVFTGDWNGGERRFNIRPRQKLVFLGIERSIGGTWYPLRENTRLAGVDDYAWISPTILRWRSRRPGDPAFLNAHLLYRLRYELSGILLKREDGYLLDHDFLFPERDGIIGRFTLRLTFDPAWQPQVSVDDSYAASGLPPGRGFVMTVPLRYLGTGTPAVLDTSRSQDTIAALCVLLGMSGLAIALFFVQEQRNGRFAPLANRVDEEWLRQHVFKYPAEVVGAAWDGAIGAPEVVALIARMVAEGKLESAIDSAGSMTLRLKTDRRTLEGHERTLVAHLFFDGRTETSSDLVKEHYKEQGLNPAREINDELDEAVQRVLPAGRAPTPARFAAGGLLLLGLGLLFIDWVAGNTGLIAAVLLAFGALLLALIAWASGLAFRASIQWGHRAAVFTLVPGIIAVAGAAAFLWFYAGPGLVSVSTVLVSAITSLALGVLVAATGGMRSRQSRAALAFRKNLAAARSFFISELEQRSPALRDEWYPWMLAFGLGRKVDDWSARRTEPMSEEPRRQESWAGNSPSVPPSAPAPGPPPQWTGFGGGRSGGAGASGSWAAAAIGIAAGVAPPRPASSGGDASGGDASGSSSSGSYSGSTSSGSSGGGGGGGW